MLVVDGLGGARHPDTGQSELETASLPNLDALARRSALRSHDARGAGNNPRQRARTPGPVRLRPREVLDGPWRARGARHRGGARHGRRRGAGQSVHGRRRRADRRPPGGTHTHGGERRARPQAGRDTGERGRDSRVPRARPPLRADAQRPRSGRRRVRDRSPDRGRPGAGSHSELGGLDRYRGGRQRVRRAGPRGAVGPRPGQHGHAERLFEAAEPAGHGRGVRG